MWRTSISFQLRKRKEANKRPHGSNFHMKKSEVPDGLGAPVFNGCQTHSVCKISERETERKGETITLRGGFSVFSKGKVAVVYMNKYYRFLNVLCL